MCSSLAVLKDKQERSDCPPAQALLAFHEAQEGKQEALEQGAVSSFLLALEAQQFLRHLPVSG